MQIAIKPAAGRILVHTRNWKVLVCTWSLTLLPSIKILKYLVKSLLIHFPFHDLIGRVRMERGEVDCYPNEKIKFLWEVGLLLFFQKKSKCHTILHSWTLSQPSRAKGGEAHLNDVRFNSNWVFSLIMIVWR